MRSRNIETFYGETQALFGASLDGRRRRGGGAARRQRRRQDDHAPLDPRPDAGRARPDPLRRARHHRGCRRIDIARAGHRLGARRPPHLPDADGAHEPAPSARSRRRFRPGASSEMLRALLGARIPDATATARTSRAARCRWSPSRGRCWAAPGLVLLDEPSQGLAPKIVQDVMKTVTAAEEEGIAVLIVEQNVLAALEVARPRLCAWTRAGSCMRGRARRCRRRSRLRQRLLGA